MNKTIQQRILWAAVAVSCVPILTIVHFPIKVSAPSIALYLSAIAGYVGVVFLLWMYMLGAKSFMSLLFKDLAPVLHVHKSLGKWGSVAFLLHPIFVAYSYFDLTLTSLTYIVIPHIDTSFERHVTLGRLAFFIIIGVWISSKLLRKRLGFRAWKYLHYFAYISLPFALLHIPEVGSQYSAHNLTRVYYFGIVALLGLFTLIRVSGWLNLDRKTYTIVSHTKVTSEDYMLILKPLTAHWFRPKIGQYVYVKQGIISEDHPFSITYFDAETGELTLTYRVFGSYTKYLATLASGQNVSVMGPFGTFTRDITPDSTSPVVYIAGGVGITPFIQRIIDENNLRTQVVVTANRTHDSAILIPTLKKALGDKLVTIYSREQPQEPTGEYGHISEEILRRRIANPQDYHYYLCGPQDFVAECKRILAAMSIPKHHVQEEEFSW